MRTSRSELKNLDSFVSDFIEVYTDHQYLIKALQVSATRHSEDPYTGRWEFQIKDYYHQRMANEVHRIITNHGGISGLQMLETCIQVNRAVDEFIIQHIQVTIALRVNHLAKRLSRLLHDLFLPVYLQDMLIDHLTTLQQLYPDLYLDKQPVKTRDQWDQFSSEEEFSIQSSSL